MSSREDNGRYRGRRRAPTPPRARYAAVVTTAFVGAGMVAIGAASTLPDYKADPSALAALNNSAIGSADLAGRQAAADRANRSDPRTLAQAATDQATKDLWLLPLKHYTITSPYGQHADSLHQGLNLAAPEGVAYYAAHSGVVKLARYNGGMGYTVVVDIGGGITVTYGHSSKLLVHEGQVVRAGDALGTVGASGYTFDNALYFEIRVNGNAVNPTTYLQQYGLDVSHGTDALSS
ncbi:MAG TPA: M23 family metallopeptidase [Rugosimonospora sp.]|nr:M23 family metallopeptidase [Rugosimonospora sp.]